MRRMTLLAALAVVPLVLAAGCDGGGADGSATDGTIAVGALPASLPSAAASVPATDGSPATDASTDVSTDVSTASTEPANPSRPTTTVPAATSFVTVLASGPPATSEPDETTESTETTESDDMDDTVDPDTLDTVEPDSVEAPATDRVVDDTRRLRLVVPREWVDRDTEPSALADGSAAPHVAASRNLTRFLDGYDEAGLTAVVVSAAPDRALDAYDFDEDCASDGRATLVNDRLTGSYEVWRACGGTTTSIVAVAVRPDGAGDTVLLLAQISEPRDAAALDAALASLQLGD